MPKGELKSEPSLAAENNSQPAPPRAARAAVAATLVEQAPSCETTKLSVAVSQAAPAGALSATHLQAEHTVSVLLQPPHLQHAS